jgi:hypothetical protein
VNRSLLLWILAAVAGVLVVAGVTYAASRLTTQAIGISSEPVSAGDGLSPRKATPTPTPRATATPRPKRPRRTPTPAATSAPTAVPTAVPTVDDHGGGDDSGSGRGRGRGRGGDDD